MNFNEKLIELHNSKGLSQDELGNALGVSRQTISAICEDVNTAKSTINIFTIIGVVGITLPKRLCG